MKRVSLLLLVAACIVGAIHTFADELDYPLAPQMLEKIQAALPTEAPAKPKKPRKVLVFTRASGFVHSSIPVGAHTFKLMGDKLGTWQTVISSDTEMFAANRVKDFDAIIMESTTGALFGYHTEADLKKASAEKQAHNDELRKNLIDFVKSGKGFVGIHAASDCSYDWPEYGELVGGYFNGHPWQKVTYKIDDPSSPLTAMFKGKEFTLTDETYTFKKEPYSRAKLHVLTSVDLDKMSDADKARENRPYDHDYGLSWIHDFGKGRVFYAAHGHREEIYWNPVMLQHYLAGIQYALGDLDAAAKP